VSCSVYLPAGAGYAEEKAGFAWVSWLFLTMRSEAKFGARFMADKIMPLSDALEGYELFDSMKVQKVVFKVD